VSAPVAPSPGCGCGLHAGPGCRVACGYARAAMHVDDGVPVTVKDGDLACGCGCHAVPPTGKREVSRPADSRESA
jgi:hypothetical protein